MQLAWIPLLFLQTVLYSTFLCNTLKNVLFVNPLSPNESPLRPASLSHFKYNGVCPPHQGLATNRVLTRLCHLQQCGTLSFNIPVQPPTTPPYSLIVYNSGNGVPKVYPLTVDGRVASWPIVYPAGQPNSFSLFFFEGLGGAC